MSNLLAQINCEDGDRAARIIQEALGIESDDVVNYCFPKEWPTDREQRARYNGECSEDRGPLFSLVTPTLATRTRLAKTLQVTPRSLL